MAESRLSEFYDRVARYERARSQGYGFETDSTLGRSHYFRPKRRSPIRFLVGLAAVLFTLVSFKAAIILFVGEGIYGERMAEMKKGDAINRLGAAILQADPASGNLVDQARIWAPKIKSFVLKE